MNIYFSMNERLFKGRILIADPWVIAVLR
eukprot:COSAG02_NODE_6391_length_3603_cov_3.955765_3_plen_28_part_01